MQASPYPDTARRRLLLGAGAAAAAGTLFSGLARAEDAYPSRAVTVTVPYAPGGQGDVFARILGERLGSRLKQTFVVENRPGASGSLGSRLVVRATPDGYHLLMGQTGEMVVNAFVMPNLGYDPQKDFMPVALVGDSPLVLAVPAASPFAGIEALIEAARAKPDAISYASSGTATPGHLAAAAMGLATKTRMVHVPYKGAGQAMADLLGSHVDCFFSSASAAMPHISAGKLRVLAVSTPQRVPALRDVPTVAESVAPGFTFSLWGGFFAPARTPQPVVDLLNREINAILADQAVRQRFEADGTTVRQNSPAEFAAFVRAEAEKYRQLVKATGVRAEG
ncbi:putattive exported protein [Bordetella ansorpii]|uniref:Putattive exported protein n=1 Tax=Bordetella ansorpii TaxID=288768 RepID=A0A157STT5_9BORD|nr:tripartite tricarboxylate transporter substrate binding protein [Bordetella ansorpii]SAI73734.1 putattive exported protein [Bordetella ansorpii]